jgi:hypothetical protein
MEQNQVKKGQFYTYQYVRLDESLYYVGKGCNGRAWISHKGHRPPKDSSRIHVQYWRDEATAFAYEVYLIDFWGRKDLGTGCLRNQTDGGDGCSGRVLSSETKKKMSDANLVDLTGKVFGRITITSRVPLFDDTKYSGTWWNCCCSCGTVFQTVAQSLGRYTNSCGCLARELTSKRTSILRKGKPSCTPIKDMVGKVFGRWTVFSRGLSTNPKDTHIFWNCVCSCGTQMSIQGKSLRTGNSKSCGCLSRELSSKRAFTRHARSREDQHLSP